MGTIPIPDERTRYSSQRTDGVDIESWPEFGEEGRKLLESVGQVIRLRSGDVVWEGGESYDLYLVHAGGVGLVDRRDDRVVVVVEPGDFVGELGMLMGQPAFLAGMATAETTLLRVRVEDLRQLIATSVELGDLFLSAFDARRRMLSRWGEGGLVLDGDDEGHLRRLREFAERNHVPYRMVLRSDGSAWAEVAATCSLPEKGAAVVTGRGQVLTEPTTRDLATAIGLDLCGLSGQARCDLLIVGAGPAGLVVMVGALPRTTWLHDVGVELDEKGFVMTYGAFETSAPGLFAVGDVRAGSVKRVASAVGEGSVVISAVHSSFSAGTADHADAFAGDDTA